MSRSYLTVRIAAIALCLAACGGDSGTTSPVTAPPPPPPPPPASVATIEVTPATASAIVGRTVTLTATTKDAQGTTLTGRTIAWASSDAAIASVSSDGVVTGVALGGATITATSEGKSAQASLSIIAIPVVSVTIAPDTASLRLAQSRSYSAVVKDDLGNVLTNRTVRWSTSNALVATVDSVSGLVLAEDDGLATITATVEGKSGSGNVRVYSPVASVSLSPALDTLEAWDVRQMQVTLRDAKRRLVTGRQVSWQVNDVAVASLDQAGILTGLDRGTVTVTATSEAISGTTKRVVVIKYRSLSVGSMHACDLASGGIAWCWGLNGRSGVIGMPQIGDNVTSAVPVQVPGDHRFIQLSTFGRHSCAIKANGAAYCWGYNITGALGAPAGAYSSTPVAVAGGIAFKQVSAGGDHTCGLDLGGRAYCWGQNQSGQLGDGTNILRTTPVAVNTTLAFSSISAGSNTTCGVATDGSLFCWGMNALGALGNGGTLGGFSTIPVRVVGGLAASHVSAGQQAVCALTAGGIGYCWGGVGVTGAPMQTSTPVPMAGGRSYRFLSQGATHGCAIATGNDIYCWGSNANGALGVPGNAGPQQPIPAGGGLRAIEVVAAGIGTGSGAHTCSVSVDRLTVHCWGQNDVGQLGNGFYTPQSVANATPSIVVSQKPLPPQ